ncbi:choice-of-anchor G family protein, partial [Microbacterium marinilacus]
MSVERKSDAQEHLRRRRLLPLAGVAVSALVAGGAYAGASGANALESDVTEAEGRVLTFSEGTIDLDQVAALVEAYSAVPSSPDVDASPLALSLLDGIDLGLGNGVQLFTDGTNNGVIGVGALGQHAETDEARAYGASGAVSDAGAISWGSTDPADSAYLDLGNLLDVVGAEIGVEDLVETVVSDLRLDLGAVSASAEKTVDGTAEGDYQIADGRLVITSPAIGGLAETLDTTAAELSDALNSALGEGGALDSALSAVTDEVIAPITDAISAIPLVGQAVAIDDVTIEATVDVDLSNALAPLLTEQFTSDDAALTIDLSEGTIEVDLARLIADTQGGVYDGTLNNLPEDTELLTPDLVQAILDGTAGTLLDEIPARAYELVTQALDSTDVNIAIGGEISAVGGVVSGTLDVQLDGQLGQLLDPDAEPLAVDASGTSISVGLPPLAVTVPVGTIAEALLTPITTEVLPVLGGVFSEVLEGAGLTDTIFRAPVEAVNALLTPLTDVLNGVVSLTANVKEDPGTFTTDTAHSPGSFTQRALELTLLPILDEPVVSLSLASATVRADAVAYDTSIEVSPTEVAPGETTTIEGTGFAPEETVVIEITDADGNVIGTIEVTADENGEFSEEWTVPEGTEPGVLDVVAEGETSGTPATDELTVTDGTSGSDTDANADTDADGNVNAAASASASANADDDSNASAQAAAQAAADADANTAA